MGTRECNHICDESSPGIGEAGLTGEWRITVPTLDPRVCTASKLKKPTCFLCWLYCPEAVMIREIPPTVNLKYCKGCGICAQVCPVKAITMVPEDKNTG